ncbi:MAG: SsrA-binding protein SmpB [Bacteroidetes bacterium]|nr:SsrA-binding protein SmpB [Bacteroidota bacterium]
MAEQINIRNKKATREFELLTKFVAGIVLQGPEIKSIRTGNANLSDSYCLFTGDELWVKNLHIAEYMMASNFMHETKRTRKLLLNRRELKKLQTSVNEKGLTIIPLRLFISERGFAKLEIALAKGRKIYDKREVLKKKETDLEMNRARKWKSR